MFPVSGIYILTVFWFFCSLPTHVLYFQPIYQFKSHLKTGTMTDHLGIILLVILYIAKGTFMIGRGVNVGSKSLDVINVTTLPIL